MPYNIKSFALWSSKYLTSNIITFIDLLVSEKKSHVILTRFIFHKAKMIGINHVLSPKFYIYQALYNLFHSFDR